MSISQSDLIRELPRAARSRDERQGGHLRLELLSPSAFSTRLVSHPMPPTKKLKIEQQASTKTQDPFTRLPAETLRAILLETAQQASKGGESLVFEWVARQLPRRSSC